MKLKVGRKVYEVTDKDIILDNKACYQIITIKDYQGTSLRIPTKLFKQLKNEGKVYLSKAKYKSSYTNIEYDLYKFKKE